ncbi:shikimate kinase [Saccharibacillus kuerlensis]|uniref:Shikimate kinase n=1 Tax=Saccharibacillus kuerlensis TaxID=459527 RepID=A0ABQ2LA21_9BACL|nr:shikimate kinase [Saccharibacillus kuerlensis]GGO08223.1 shikimate kinase [Saccharibacillus kuerlensis]
MIAMNTEIPLSEKNIILIGFMGAGKTTIGQLLANKLDRPFLDADQEIEQKYGMPVTEIFKCMGEPAFRQIEKDYLTKLCHNSRSKVVSLGGGSFMQDEIRQACLSSGIVYHLDLQWEEWLKRFEALIGTRPLLQSKSLEEIEELFNSRKIVYADNHYTIAVDAQNPEQIAEAMAQQIRVSWQQE